MIVIPFEMWPHGRVTKKFSLGEIRIINDGTGTSSRGNYIVEVWGKSKARPARKVTIKDWPRLSRPVHELVLAALLAAGYGYRNQDIPKLPLVKHEPPTSESLPRNDDIPEIPFG